jgi:hypothetical protein
MDWMDMQVSYIAGTPYVGAEVHMLYVFALPH